MSLDLVKKIAYDLGNLQYKGAVVLCGYGEPLLHPQIVEVVQALRAGGDYRIEVVTNGDFLGPAMIHHLINAGVNYFVVSLYDGPHQIEKIKKNFADVKYGDEYYLLRDRWHSEVDQFGLKLTNRGGTVSIGPQEDVDTHRPCYYLTYQMQVDWNGDVILCPQDWYKRLRFGNLNIDSMFAVWTSKRMQKRRQQLIDGKRIEHPCSQCNTDGTLHGFNHVEQWRKK